MASFVCTECDAELIPGASYCRRCGNPVTQPVPNSEQVTAILDKSPDASTTKRLDPRPTTPNYEAHSALSASDSASPVRTKSSWLKPVTLGVTVSLLLVVLFAV